MLNITIKILSNKSKKTYENDLLKLYDPENRRNNKYKKGFINSKYIIIALLENKVIGAVRIITDMFMSAIIIDLFVNQKYRLNGIGKELIITTINLCIKKGIKNIELIADPKDKGLPNFYEKLGFENNPKNGLLMSFKK